MYTREMYEQQKKALDAATGVISALTQGERANECSIYETEYAEIASYFAVRNLHTGVDTIGATARRVFRMFTKIMTAPRITGFEANEYGVLLKQCQDKIKSLRVFKRKPKIKCFEPRVHRQPCYCARMEAAMAAVAIANSQSSDAIKTELTQKVQAALELENEL
jgi:hypothetical protein